MHFLGLLQDFVKSLDPLVLRVAGGIFLLAVIAWVWSVPPLYAAIRNLRSLAKFLKSTNERGKEAFVAAEATATSKELKGLMREAHHGLFELPTDSGPRYYTLRPYRELFTPRALLAHRLNLNLFESMPNILIGIGLLFTFIFLAMALSDIKPAFAKSDPEALRDAIGRLLGDASGKFITSIVGMGCSILWTYFSKRLLAKVDRATDDLCRSLQSHADDTGAEAAISTQVTLLNEILAEDREQVGQLRRFETDFAVAIAKQMGTALAPSFENMAESITKALKELTAKIGTINEDALRTMLLQFQEALRESASTEMQDFRNALMELAKRLEVVGLKFGEDFKIIGDEFGKKGQEMADHLANTLGKAASELSQSSTLLGDAMLTAKATVNDIDAVIETATHRATEGMLKLGEILTRMSAALAEIDGIQARLGLVTKEISAATSNVSTSSARLADIVDRQGALIKALETMSPMSEEFRHSASQMQMTVKEMREGVSDYTKQISDIHRTLDDALGRAISKLDGTIPELSDCLEEMVERLPERSS